MKKSKTEGDAARKLKADSLVHVQKWHKDIKTRTKKLNKSKTKSIEPRPAWVDVVIPTFHEDAIKAARKKKKNKGLLQRAKEGRELCRGNAKSTFRST